MCKKRKPSLLDVLAEIADCSCLSDLRFIKNEKRYRLVEKIETISVDDYPLNVWNDALVYLTAATSAPASSDARQWIIDYYRKCEAMLLTQTPQGGASI